MNINDLFNLSLIDRASKPALLLGKTSLSFGELDVRSSKTAKFLHSLGFSKGDRLGIYLENCLEFVDFYLACLKLGVIIVPINILYRDREISHIINDAQPKAILAKEKLGSVDTILIDELPDAIDSSIPALPNINGDDPAAIIYTSGTTGTSKGAVLSHHNFMANTMNLNTCWKITEDDRLLLGLPLFHVHGLANGMHCAFTAGATTKLLPKFEHQKLPAEFESFHPTLFYGVPTVYVRMLDHPETTAKKMGQSVRLFVSGSAPLPPQVMTDFKEKYGHTILERYGMTETLMNISNPYVGERRPGTVGFPLPGLSAKIVKPDGSLAGTDEEGELYLKGPNVFSKYWNRKEATAAAFDKEGYFKTGDMATISEDGYYTLRGRKSDLIISGGFNIYPREIEEFLLEQDEISEAAVVGVPDKVRGELPVAFVVANGQLDLAALEDKCRKALASFKVPRKFVIKDSLPRTALGKVQKHVLKTELD
ncbi:MAG: acyl-CoA synthetase [Cyclobacteriaceae bacterium]|nr:acyl-CoA synthetase [Cyclobacteriaceae bacterium]